MKNHENRDISVTVWPIVMKFGMLMQICPLTVALHMGVISDPTVDNATISPVLNNIVPNGSMTL